MTHYFQFVDSIGPTSTVLLDLDDDAPFGVENDSSVSPPSLRRTTAQTIRADGELEIASSYSAREIQLVLTLKELSAETQALTIQKLARILDQREGAWLKWQSEGMSQPMFYRTRRASFDTIDDILSATPTRSLHVTLAAYPFAYGSLEFGSFTITNDPTAGTNKMMYGFGTIKGDVPAPLNLGFPIVDGIHRTHVASQAMFGGPTLAADTFTRANSTTTLGSAESGGTWTAQAGTWGINGNQGYMVTGAAATWSTAVLNPGISDGTVEVTIPNVYDGTVGIVVRSNSSTTGFAVTCNQMYDIATSAAVGPTYSATIVGGDRMRVVLWGTSITVFRQAGATGPWVQVMTTTSATYLTSTKHGLVAYGTGTTAARFDNFKLSADAPQSSPYYMSLTAGAVNAAPPAGWTVADAADSTMVGGSRRTLTKTSGTALCRPTNAVVQQWNGLPPGDYRVMVRTGAAPAGTELLFFNRPPSTGSELIRTEAVGKAVITQTTTGKDWHDLGVVAMPGGAPITDIAFGFGSAPGPALWNVAVYSSAASMTVDLDAVVLVPAGRPATLTKLGSVAFPSTYTGRVVTWDGLNYRRFATGTSTFTAGVNSVLPPSDLTGGNPIVAPNASNILHFFATTADPASASRVSDDKTTTTVINWSYYPAYLYARPATT